ncbi:extracellular elastinolytic metallo proteinase [Dactylonectria estremocensis]|uniref:Extracellular metalloproteinase n=1 Tax=Dactylonectria estremocensis TaxID=1079267 RepID=A0A9P9JEV8_9HYPO|nr:extracellular elastinolytic metallo proteinase [Dactylonectria estremocensis]
MGDNFLETARNLIKAVVPGATFVCNGDFTNGTHGFTHVWFTQTWNDKKVPGQQFNVNMAPNGTVFSYGHSFDPKMKSASSLQRRSEQDPLEALNGIVKALSLPFDVKNAKAKHEPAPEGNELPMSDSEPEESDHQQGFDFWTFTGIKGETVPRITAQSVYVNKGKKGLVPAWEFETRFGSHYYLTHIEADTNTQILDSRDLVSDFSDFATFNVYNPSGGSRIVVENPWDVDASPWTWFGDARAPSFTTAGNNVIAHSHENRGPREEKEEKLFKSYSPESVKHDFNYHYDATIRKPQKYRDVSITQAFYTENKCHDLYYLLGFDEEAGNFQNTNNGKSRAGDGIVLDVQRTDLISNARSRIYPWPVQQCTNGEMIPVSSRLTGGKTTIDCFYDIESLGISEGWSDFMPIAIGVKPGDTRHKNVFMGVWLEDSPKGSREYPYSVDTSKNPLLFESLEEFDSRDDRYLIGSLWGTVLFEAMWNLIDKYGVTDNDKPKFRPSTEIPTDGKYLAMKLAIDAMRKRVFQSPCNPRMLQVRDAIIDADFELTGGENVCELWRAFSKRGLGVGAKHVPGPSKPSSSDWNGLQSFQETNGYTLTIIENE